MLDKSNIFNVNDVHSSADIIDEDPISDQCHERSHYERGEQVHVQSVPWISQFSKKEESINRKLIYEPVLQYWTKKRERERERNVPEQRENDHCCDQHSEGRGISNLRDDPDDR